MTRTTESINNVRIDKANHAGYDLAFTITTKTNGLASITVNGSKNGEYIFAVSKTIHPSSNISVNFYKGNYDFQIVMDIFTEIMEIEAEFEAE